MDNSNDAPLIREKECQAVDETTGAKCGERESLQILEKFRNLYEERISKVNEENDNESIRTSLKLQIMTDWVKDLGEQNKMLVHTVNELETSSSKTVKLLTEKLQNSSDLATVEMKNYNQSQETLNDLSNRINNLEDIDVELRNEIERLQNDIRGLLELIRRGVEDNCWNDSGINFLEIDRNAIPAPLGCKCGEDPEKIHLLQLKIQDEAGAQGYQTDLKKRITNLEEIVKGKEKALSNINSKVQCLCKTLKEHSTLANQTLHSLDSATLELDITKIAECMENAFIEKKNDSDYLNQQLDNTKKKLEHEHNVNECLQSQLEKKCMEFHQLQQELACLKKEASETREALTMEVATKHDSVLSLKKGVAELEEKCRIANIRASFQDDVIKELRKELKGATLSKEIQPTRRVCIDTSSCQEKYSKSLSRSSYDIEMIPDDMLDDTTSEQKELLTYLKNIESLMEKEKDALTTLKTEFKKMLKNSNNKGKQIHEQDSSAMQEILNDIAKLLIEYKTQAISHIQKFDSGKNLGVIENTDNSMNAVAIKQFKLMEEFRVCTVEAQAATEDIHEEVEAISSDLNYRREKYKFLFEKSTKICEFISHAREEVTKTLNRLNIQNEDRMRYIERIDRSKIKLKDMKNCCNKIQLHLCSYVNKLQKNDENFPEIVSYNNLLNMVTDEMDQLTNDVQVFETQGRCALDDLQQLKKELSNAEFVLKDLKPQMDGTLLENKIAETSFCERIRRLEKLEAEVDCSHSKMQDVLETFLNIGEQENDNNCKLGNQMRPQFVDNTLKTKNEFYDLKKKYDELRQKSLESSSQMQTDPRVIQLQIESSRLLDYIKNLELEIKCKQEANYLLKRSLEEIEKELSSRPNKVDVFRRCNCPDNEELNQKVLTWEKEINSHKEIEYDQWRKSAENKNFSKVPWVAEIQESASKYEFHLKHENDLEVLNDIQKMIEIMKCNLIDFKTKLSKNFSENETRNASVTSEISVMDDLTHYAEELTLCSQRIDVVKTAISDKDKILENLNEVIRNQKKSINMSQAELKEMYQNLQRENNQQKQTIIELEHEIIHLKKLNELQIQTIQHLQDAVVEVKRNSDQKGHKAVNDSTEYRSSIPSSKYGHGNVYDV